MKIISMLDALKRYSTSRYQILFTALNCLIQLFNFCAYKMNIRRTFIFIHVKNNVRAVTTSSTFSEARPFGSSL